MVLRIEMLPADRGDSILIEYGSSADVEHRVLIDGGHMNAYQDLKERLLAVPTDAEGRRQFELLVVTHIDTDHIDGAIALMQDQDLRCWFNDIWLNGWRHLRPLTEDGAPVSDPTVLGPKQGEFLGGLLEHLGQPWNRYFAGGPIFVPDAGELPRVAITGGLELTLLSPTLDKLRTLRKEWKEVIEATDNEPGLGPQALVEFGSMLADDSLVTLGDEDKRSTLDKSEANGASIAFLAEYGDRRLLLTGDGFADVLRVSMDRWLDEQAARSDSGERPDRVPLDAFKLAHHGSKRNVTPQLMGVISCSNYLVSTNGAGRAKHPDVEAITMIRDEHHTTDAHELPTICFNYKTEENDIFEGVAGMTTKYEADAVVAWDTP